MQNFVKIRLNFRYARVACLPLSQMRCEWQGEGGRGVRAHYLRSGTLNFETSTLGSLTGGGSLFVSLLLHPARHIIVSSSPANTMRAFRFIIGIPVMSSTRQEVFAGYICACL